MSQSIDQRVVEMRFDNKQFESATKQTLGTLQKLKEALNFSGQAKSMGDLSKSVKDVDLSTIASGVAALEKRFSTLGIVGMQVIRNITNALTNTLMKGFNFVNDSIMAGGKRRAMNLENARFQLQSIIKDSERVAEVMKVASDSVDGTAYSFDVAAKAASQFTASGITDMDRMGEALRGMAGVTATFNADYEQMSMIFTQVAGQGRLMGDQLLQLSTRGANAAATIAEYVNGVTEGSIEARDEVTATIKAISNGAKVTEGDIRKFVSEGKINFDIFASAMSHAFGDSAKEANKTFNGALSNVKAALARIGAGFFEPLIAQESEIVRLFNALRVRINDVKKGLVFDEALGNLHALSKQVTDSILGLSKGLADYLENLDLTEHMTTFYYWVEIVKNGAKGIYSVVKPMAQAFKDVFLNFSITDVKNLSKSIWEFTKNLRLSEEGSKDLKDAFTGILSVSKLVIDAFVGIIKTILNVDNPMGSLIKTVIKIEGAFGRALIGLTDWIRESETVRKATLAIGSSISSILGVIPKLVSKIIELGKSIDFLPTMEKLLIAIVGCFLELGKVAAPYVSELTSKMKDLAVEAARMIPEKLIDLTKRFTSMVDKLRSTISKLDFKKSSKQIKEYTYDAEQLEIRTQSMGFSFKRLLDVMSGFDSGKLVDFSAATDKMGQFKETVTNFSKWVVDTLKRLFSDASLQELISGAAGIGIVYSFSKAAKSIEKAFTAIGGLSEPLKALSMSLTEIAKSIGRLPKAIGETLSGVNKAIKAYQNDLNASALIKIAGAIAILALAIGGLSFLDTDKVMVSAKALSLIAGTFLVGITLLKKVSSVGKTTADSLYEFTSGLHKALDNFAKAKKWNAIGNTMKSFGISIALISGSLVALALMYKNDGDALKESIKIISGIATAIVGVIGVMSVLGNRLSTGMKSFSKAAMGITAISLALTISVSALKQLFKMQIPVDAEEKLTILGGIYAALGLLALVLAQASSDSKGNKLSTGPILALTVMLISTVKSIQKLFDLQLPYDWKIKTGIMAGIFMALSAVMIAIGYSAKLAGGAIKAAGTILSMCLFVGTIVAALIVLSIMPGDKLLKGAIALGGILVALGTALYGAGQIADPNATKAVFAMAIMVGTIVAALGILAMISGDDLKKGAIALGSVLVMLAGDLYAASKISNKAAWLSVGAMILQVIAIAGSLYILSSQPWDGMLAAGVAMGLTLLAFAGAFKILSTVKVDLGIIGVLTAGILGLVGVAAVLYILSNQPWEGLLSAAAALSETLIALTACLAVLSMVGANIPAALQAVGALDIFIANLAVVLLALGALAEIPGVTELIAGGSGVLSQLGGAIGKFVGSIISGFGEGITSGLPQIGTNLSQFAENLKPFLEGMRRIDGAVLDGVLNLVKMSLAITAANFIEGVSRLLGFGNSLENFGTSLVTFAPLISKFADIVKDINPAAITGAAVATQIMSELANNLPDTGGIKALIMGDNDISIWGAKLVIFGSFLKAFAFIVKDINPSAVTGAASAGMMMAELANSIPKTGGLQALFSGDNSLDDFGRKLVTFGQCMKAYADSVSGINVVQLAGVITAFRSIIDASALVAGVDTSAMSKFSRALVDMSNNALGSFMTEFQNGAERVKNVISNSLEMIITQMKSKEKDFKEQGKNLIEIFVKAAEDVIKKDFKNLANEMQDTGKLIVDAAAKGITSNLDVLRNASAQLAGVVDPAFRKTLEYHSPPHKIVKTSKLIPVAAAKGVKDNAPVLNEAMADLANGANKALVEGFDVGSVYEVYGDALKPVTNVVKLASDSAKKMNQITEQQVKDTKTNTKKAAKAHGEAVKEEQDYWTKLLAVKKTGAEAEKYAETTIKEFRTQVLEETTAALKEYSDQLDSTRESIMGQIDLFSEVEEKEYKTKDELIDNLNAQIDAYGEYVQILTELNERLGEAELGDYLRQMGVDSLDQLREINSMTDSELSEYAMLYEDKLALANDAAIQQLTGMQAETEAKLAEIFGGMTSAVNLFDFSAVFDGSIESLNNYINDVMIPLQNAQLAAQTGAEGIGEGIKQGLLTGLDPDQLRMVVGTSLEGALALIAESEAEKANETGETIGENLTEGVSEGIEADTETPKTSAQKLMDLIEEAMKAAGEIHSPSARSNREVGQPITQGVAEGMIEDMSPIDNSVLELMTHMTEAFKEHLEEVTNVGTELSQTLALAIQNQGENFTLKGSEAITSFIQGVRDKFEDSVNTTNELITSIITAISERSNDFLQSGTANAMQYLTAIKNLYGEAYSTGTTFTNQVLSAINNLTNSFYNSGVNAGRGFVDGIRSQIAAAEAAGRALASAASSASARELDEHSPSRVTYKIGDFAGLGFVNAILANVAKAAKAGEELGDAASNSIKDSISNVSRVFTDEIGDPVIRPTVDLSDVNASADEIVRLFNDAIQTNAISANIAASSIEHRRKEQTKDEGSADKERGNVNVNLVQNNYSPKNLNRVEIYRKTKNQLSTAKGVIDKL